jgi:hypothetical protein
VREEDVILHPGSPAYHDVMTEQRALIDLVSVGPATVEDLEDLGITEVEHLIDKDATELFAQLQELRGTRVDPCCQDVFSAAIAQARDPNLPKARCQWHYYSRLRKGQR